MHKSIVYAIVLGVSFSIGTAIMNQIRKGELRLDHALFSGVLFGIVMGAFHFWKINKRSNGSDAE